MTAYQIRIQGIVQGVGFRPTVWKVAHQLKLTGQIRNDNEGVLIHVWCNKANLAVFIDEIKNNLPILARIDTIKTSLLTDKVNSPENFTIEHSQSGDMNTRVVPDAATCKQCLEEILAPSNRRYRYPFTNCTHCGPRMSIIKAMPYDRKNTSMAVFPMCPQCLVEYQNPSDRRFHAQPNACPDCGPKVWLEDNKGQLQPADSVCDVPETAARLIRKGYIVAVKGIGGFHLACDAGNHKTVSVLRKRKHRYQKPFALMAKDIAMLSDYAETGTEEEALLTSHAAPVVILPSKVSAQNVLSEALAPGQNTLGFMLPYTPVHYLLMQNMSRPIVLTSGNLSEEPQLIDNDSAREKLSAIADYFLMNDRDIINRVDDSVVRIMAGKARFLRMARGYAPQTINLPEGFPDNIQVLAMGGELKNTFCLLKNATLVVSQYIGDLENTLTFENYQYNLELYQQLYDFKADIIAVDKHPDYLSTQMGQQKAGNCDLELIKVQHHHAHIASCMLEHGMPFNSGPVLGIALDGLGFGEDGTIWGGEFLLTRYQSCRRLAGFQPVRMPGGTRAIIEPWRNTLAHLLENQLWDSLLEHDGEQGAEPEIIRFIKSQPLNNIIKIIKQGLNSPYASSAGRLFDAVAAALGICTESVSFEGQAAIELEALASDFFDAENNNAYPHVYQNKQIIWQAMWQALFEDLKNQTDIAIIAARFHQCVVQAVVHTALSLCAEYHLTTVVLSGGVFQNKLLLEGVSVSLRKHKLKVIIPELLPVNDAGISAGQAVVASGAVDHLSISSNQLI